MRTQRWGEQQHNQNSQNQGQFRQPQFRQQQIWRGQSNFNENPRNPGQMQPMRWQQNESSKQNGNVPQREFSGISATPNQHGNVHQKQKIDEMKQEDNRAQPLDMLGDVEEENYKQ